MESGFTQIERSCRRLSDQPNNPLHGIKLQQIIEDLYNYYGWEQLSYHININCFKNDPSIKSSLTFLRRHKWARDEVEALWIEVIWKKKP